MSEEQSQNSADDKDPERPWLFKPGQSGNPGGRPKGSFSFASIVKRKLSEVPAGQQKSYAEGIVDRTIADALKGNKDARKVLWESVDGQARETLDVTVSTPDYDSMTGEELDVCRRDLSLRENAIARELIQAVPSYVDFEYESAADLFEVDAVEFREAVELLKSSPPGSGICRLRYRRTRLSRGARKFKRSAT